MKKILIIVLISIFGYNTNAQIRYTQLDTIANVFIKNNDSSTYCYYLSAINPNYKGTDKYTHSFLISDSLNPELDLFIGYVKLHYARAGDTLVSIEYQNISQSGTGYERFWIVTKKGNIDIPIYELPEDIQQALYLFGEKIIGNIKKGYYYEN